MTGYFTAVKRVGSTVIVAFLEQGCSMAVTFLLLARWAGSDSGQAALAVAAGSCAADVLGFWALLAVQRRITRRSPRRRPPCWVLRTGQWLTWAEGPPASAF